MTDEDWAEVRRSGLKPLAWMAGIFLLVMMFPVALGALIGVLHLGAYQMLLWLIAALALACLAPPCIGPLRKLLSLIHI